MGKPTKSSGGDERNMSVRKSNKSTNKASSDDASLAERQSEIESSSRSKNSVTYVKPGPARSKSKLRSPVKVGLGHPVNRVNKPNIVSVNKEVKKAIGIVKTKSQMTKMKPETETVERKQKIESKESTEQVENVKQVLEVKNANEELVEQQEQQQHENGSTNGVNGKETPVTEENGNSEQNGSEAAGTTEKEEEFNLHLESEENIQPDDNTPKESAQENKEEEKQNENETPEVKENTQSDAESCSVDVVESTTSDVSEATESTASPEVKEKDGETQDANNDAVSYDSSITLMDVKVKLNDCLKDPQSEENDEESNVNQSKREDTFGKTLRTISGRSSIGRMRHITLRERQSSPNSSLFVNTSIISEDGTLTDSRILRHRSNLSELASSSINNGTPLIERKRKFIEETSLSPKKPKTEEGGILNASIELLKYPFSTLRRPVEISAPENFGEDNKQQLVNADEGYARKWCVLM